MCHLPTDVWEYVTMPYDNMPPHALAVHRVSAVQSDLGLVKLCRIGQLYAVSLTVLERNDSCQYDDYEIHYFSEHWQATSYYSSCVMWVKGVV